MQQHFQASGKLLIFGEYLVVKGVDCLAMPLKFGQQLQVQQTDDPYFDWTSYALQESWFSLQFTHELEIVNTSDQEIAERLIQLLKWIQKHKPAILQHPLSFQTRTDFPLSWGLGTSSTLISLLAQWSTCNPYELLEASFKGSGYDIACATAETPIVYNTYTKQVKTVTLPETISNHLLFVYSGRKQNSQKEVAKFNQLFIPQEALDGMQDIVNQAVKSQNIAEWEVLIRESESLLAGILKLPKIQNQFPDYEFAIKSLGAWGGDFFMATFEDEHTARTYFAEKGFTTQFNYQEFIKR